MRHVFKDLPRAVGVAVLFFNVDITATRSDAELGTPTVLKARLEAQRLPARTLRRTSARLEAVIHLGDRVRAVNVFVAVCIKVRI